MNKTTQPAQESNRKVIRRSGAPPGPRRADQRRSALLKAARSLFGEKGYEATTMDEIAAAASFAKGTLYHYFTSKAELLQVLRKEFEEEVMKRIRSRVERCPEGDYRGRIKAWIDAAVDAYFEMSDLHDVVIYGSGMPLRNAMADAEITRYLKTLITDGTKEKAWNVDDEHWAAVVMFYSFRGGCDEAIIGAQHQEDIPTKLYELFLRILGVHDLKASKSSVHSHI